MVPAGWGSGPGLAESWAHLRPRGPSSEIPPVITQRSLEWGTKGGHFSGLDSPPAPGAAQWSELSLSPFLQQVGPSGTCPRRASWASWWSQVTVCRFLLASYQGLSRCVQFLYILHGSP